MRKFILLLCLFATTIAQAQTKEETMAWIKNKLQNANKFGATVEVTECEVKVVYKWGIRIYQVHGIEFTKTGQMYTGSDAVRDVVYANYKGFTGIKLIENTGKIDFLYRDYICEISEENIIERLQKAFNHLATFCPKKKEVF